MAYIVDFDDRKIVQIKPQENWYYVAMPGLNQVIIAKGNKIDGFEAV